MSDHGTCMTCAYSCRLSDVGIDPCGSESADLACRRYPPTPALLDPESMSYDAIVPVVGAFDWCGEYRAER